MIIALVLLRIVSPPRVGPVKSSLIGSLVKRGRQAAGVEHADHGPRLPSWSMSAGDLAAVGDRALDVGARVELAVENDAQLAA